MRSRMPFSGRSIRLLTVIAAWSAAAGTGLVLAPSAAAAGTATHTVATVNPSSTTYGSAVTYTASVLGAGGTPPTGTVTFKVGSAFMCVAPLTGSPTPSATCSSPNAPGGSDTVDALYSGDSNFDLSDGTTTLTVNKASTTTSSVTATPAGASPPSYGESVTYSANVAHGAGAFPQEPSGSVTFTIGSTTLCTGTLAHDSVLNVNTASCPDASAPVGANQTITATYNGDGNYSTSSGTLPSFTVNKADSTTNLTITPSSSAYGQQVAYKATITNASNSFNGSPSGTVVFSVQGGPTLCSATITSGVGTCSGSTTPAGALTIVGAYMGDSNFNGSQGQASETISAASTSTAISGPSRTTTSSAPTFMATVTNTTSGSSASPSGHVDISVAGQTCTAAITSGSGSCQLPQPIATQGVQTVSGTFTDPNNNFANSAGTTTILVDNAAPTTTTMSVSRLSSAYGTNATFNATVTSGTGTPAGSVTFTIGSQSLCTATLFAGSGSCSSNAAPAGSNTVVGTYDPGTDATHDPSSGQTGMTVTKASSATSVTVTNTVTNTASGVYGQTVQYTATLTDSSAGSTGTPDGGTVTFTAGSTQLCQATVSHGSGHCPSANAPVGTDTITGTYANDSNFNGSNGQATLTVTKAASKTVVSVSPPSTSVGQPVTYSAVVTDNTASSTGTPSGSVQFSIGSTQLCTATLASDGTGSCAASNAPIGDKQTVTGNYTGDASFTTSQGTALLSIAKAPTMAQVTVTPNTSVYGQQVTYSATITSTFAGTPTGTVSFSIGQVSLCSATLSGGHASCPWTNPPPTGDNQTVTAGYNGDSTYAGSQGTAVESVSKAASSTSVSVNPSSVAPTQSVTYTASVTDATSNSTGTPTGTVTFTVGSTQVCPPAAVGADGHASCSSNTAPTGSNQTVTGAYSGDSNFGLSSGTTTLNVGANLHPTTTSVIVNQSSTYGQTQTYSATVTSTSPGTPSGSVTFTVGSTTLCVGTLNSGLASCTAHNAPVGSDTITGQYSGDSQFAGGSPGTATQNVSKANSATTVTASPASPAQGQSVTYTAKVTDASPSSSGTPTGSVPLTINSTALCTAILNPSNGTGSCTASNAPAGTDTVTGTYAGDANFNGSTGATQLTVASAAGGFVAQSPARVLDTRDGTGGTTGPVNGGQTVKLDLSHAVPSTATAVALNVTAVAASTSTFVTVWPDGSTRPTASNLNVAAGQTIPNLVIVQLGPGQMVDLFNQRGTVNLVADLDGYFDSSNSTGYKSQTPVRTLDTRNATGGTTGPVQAGQTVRLNLSNAVPPTATAVVLNVTATAATAPTFVTVWPDGSARPTASSLNVVTGQTIPNLVVVQLGPGRIVDLYNHTGNVQLVADLEGVFDSTQAPGLLPQAPQRVVDTRNGTGGTSGPLGAGNIMQIDFTGVLPAGAKAVVLNVTGVGASADTFFTLWPDGATRPNASNLNVPAGGTIPNLVIVKLGAGNVVDLYNQKGVVNVVADLEGAFT